MQKVPPRPAETAMIRYGPDDKDLTGESTVPVRSETDAPFQTSEPFGFSLREIQPRTVRSVSYFPLISPICTFPLPPFQEILFGTPSANTSPPFGLSTVIEVASAVTAKFI